MRVGAPPTANTETDHNVVSNNYIHDGGILFAGAIGVWVGHASDNEISHNEICDLNYTGISVGWSWGYGETKHHRNEIAYNHLHHLGRGVLGDMGAIYTLGISPGTKLHHNLIHDIWCYDAVGAGGIYPDEGSSQIVIENNVVYRTYSGGLTFHYGKDDTVRNNIFAYGYGQQVVRGRNEEHIAFNFERNIVYFNSGRVWAAGGPNRNWRADANLYWDTTGSPLRFLNDLSLEEWRALGFDRKSVVADPLFVAPARGDFRLKPNSPALKLGFKPIDIREAGLIGSPEWVSLPRQISRAPVSFTAIPQPRPVLVNDDFEATPVGVQAEQATTHGETAAATVRVSGERAAGGKRSLKFTDAPGLDQPWNPHIWYTPNLGEGLAELQYDVWVGPGALVWHEWRDAASPYRVGPNIGIDATGQLTAGRRPLITVPHETWIHVAIVCGLGKQASGKYDLTVTVAGGQPQRFADLPCDPSLRRLEWLGFVSNATEQTVFYLDNVQMRLLKSGSAVKPPLASPVPPERTTPDPMPIGG